MAIFAVPFFHFVEKLLNLRRKMWRCGLFPGSRASIIMLLVVSSLQLSIILGRLINRVRLFFCFVNIRFQPVP
jgi:hypothetical protein